MKKFMEALEEQQEFEKKQKKLHDKHEITDENIVVVEKNNMIKFSVRSIASAIRLIAVFIMLFLAVTGLICIIYPETRKPLQGIYRDALSQISILTGNGNTVNLTD